MFISPRPQQDTVDSRTFHLVQQRANGFDHKRFYDAGGFLEARFVMPAGAADEKSLCGMLSESTKQPTLFNIEVLKVDHAQPVVLILLRMRS